MISNINRLLTLTFHLELIIMINLTGQSKDRGLLDYDIEINVHLKPSTITDSLKELKCCSFRRGI